MTDRIHVRHRHWSANLGPQETTVTLGPGDSLDIADESEPEIETVRLRYLGRGRLELYTHSESDIQATREALSG